MYGFPPASGAFKEAKMLNRVKFTAENNTANAITVKFTVKSE